MTNGTVRQLPAVIPQRAEEPDEVAELRRELAEAREREEAVRMVLRALIASVRPLGLNRKRFSRCVREEGELSASEGPQAARHAVLLQEARRVLREVR